LSIEIALWRNLGWAASPPFALWRRWILEIHRVSAGLLGLASVTIALILITREGRTDRQRFIATRGVVWSIAGLLLISAFAHLREFLEDAWSGPVTEAANLAMAGVSWALLLVVVPLARKSLVVNHESQPARSISPAGIGNPSAANQPADALLQNADVESPSKTPPAEAETDSRNWLTDRRIQSHHSIRQIWASTRSLETAVPPLLEMIGREFGFDVAELWLADQPAGPLRLVSEIRIPLPPTEGMESGPVPGCGSRTSPLPSRLQEARVPLWLEDRQGRAMKGDLLGHHAASLNWNTAVEIPVPGGGEARVIGVICLFSRVRRERDEGLLETLSIVATQVGLLAERRLAEARKNEFLAMLGHELRNPLAPIRNAVRVMKQTGSNDPTLRWAQDVIDHQVRQLAHLVDDLLDISRVTRGKVRLQKEVVDVATIVNYALETSRPAIDARRHRLAIAMPPFPIPIYADPLRMAQVLSNLLNNAAKYTDEEGQIRLVVGLEDASVVFRVSDNGIGIPSEMLSTIFDLFAQLDSSLDRSQGGLGLGLTLVRSLVEMHDGTVEAQSDGPGKGSEFVIRLPVWKQAADPAIPSSPSSPPRFPASPNPAPERAAAEQARPPSRRVLVVEDNIASAQSLAMLLTLEGHEVQVAHDGPSALELIAKYHHEAVLMDIGLPGMTGYEAARQIRERSENRNVLLVAITGYAEDEAKRRSRAAGFDHHFVKPVDPEEVLALLASIEWTRRSDAEAAQMEPSRSPSLPD
jgi:signal transduction histidine kinase/CheY-like chemotaxis protein